MGLVKSLLRGNRPRAQWFAGARVDDLTRDWIFGPMSADEEIRGELSLLRGRSRELTRNVSWARRYTRHVANNVIGHRGIRLQGRLDAGPVANQQLEAAWKEWGRVGSCTVDGKLSWLGLQRLIMTSLPVDGETLVRLVRGFDNDFGFALQLLDPDQLDHTYNRMADPNSGQREIRMGVEIDDWSRPIAYHLWSSDSSRTYERVRQRVPADQILHFGDPYRPNQTRYLPWFTSVMLDANMLRGYFEAELVASRVAATKGGFFTRKGSDDMHPGPEPEKAPDKLVMDAEPGVFEELPYGVEFTSWDPTHPTHAFGDFTKAILRSISSGLGISYTALTGDLTDVNYSSIRAGMLDERDVYRAHQQWLIEQLHDRVYREWFKLALLAGRLDPRIDLPGYAAVEWQPRGWAWVDPEKDMKAAAAAVDRGFNSRTNIVGEQGRDLEEVFTDLEREREMAESHGIDLDAPGNSKATASGGNGARPMSLEERRDWIAMLTEE